MGRRVDVQVDDAYRAAVATTWLRGVARRALEAAGASASVEMGLVLTSDDTLRRLNRDYRGLDEVTDVLAFSFAHQGHYEGKGDHPAPDSDIFFPTPPGTAENLGDVIISYPQAERQARAQGHPVEREVALLVSHGVLHLLGHDHLEEDEARAMRALESRVLAELS